jgi:putative PIG3 family NAD(P)H quinone oxidoreductase
MREIPAERRFVAVNPDDHSLSIETGPTPEPAPDELLIKVSAAGLNRADLMQRKGLYPAPADASPIMGLEVAGEVLATGEGVSGWAPGDKVCALTHGGGYADCTVAPAGQSLPLPDGMSMIEGACLPEALLTVWHNLFQRCGLAAGETVLIHGGASGIGTLGIGICRALGTTVYTTAGTDEKCEALEELGAVKAVNYKTGDFEEVFTGLGLKGQINVFLDMAGGDFLQKNLDLAAPEGRIVYIAFPRGAKTDINLVPLMMNRLTVTGSTLRAQSFEQKAVMVEEIMDQVFPHLESGAIRPVIDSVFPLDDVEQAHERMQSGEHMGKIILEI